MAYGISIQNASGSVIIREDYQNYHLIASGSFGNGASLPSLAATDLLFIRPSANGHELVPHAGTIYSSSGAVEYVIVRNQPVVTTDRYGIRVYTSTGAIAFDSTRRSVVPVSIFRYGQPSYSMSASITQPNTPIPGRKRYINSSCLRRTGIAESGAGDYDLWRVTWIYWGSDSSMVAYEGPNSEYGDLAPGGTEFPMWGGTMIFSFADV